MRTIRITPSQRRAGALLACSLALAACLVLLRGGDRAPAQDLQEKLSDTQSKIAENREKEGVLSTTIAKLSDKVRGLTQEVATLRNREAAVQDELAKKQAQLNTAEADLARAQTRLAEMQARLKRAVHVLEKRLVAIYESGTPDVLTVILQADGFADLVERNEYLNLIQDGDSALVGRVRSLRDEIQLTVDHLAAIEAKIKKARDEIAAQRAALQTTRSSLEASQGALSAARGDKEAALDSVQRETNQLEEHEADLEGKIRAELGSGGPALPAGPIRGAGSGFIWPVNGPVVSPFGQRWGRLHAGIDIAVGTGVPIRAAKGGVVALASPYGGYGNYTCINHGGGLSTCYAHQTQFMTSSGASVKQGQVIGTVGCTGHCFGPHLHFEVRVGGVPQDPMGYL